MKTIRTIFSPCRKYRYTLWREWSDLLPRNPEKAGFVQFIGLNPSTADEIKNDNTVLRCVGFATNWGYSAMCMTNLFAWRDTDPKNMKAAVEPVGEENLHIVRSVAEDAALVVCCWGNHGTHLGQSAKLLEQLKGVQLHCFGITKKKQPTHPLYLPNDIVLKPFTP